MLPRYALVALILLATCQTRSAESAFGWRGDGSGRFPDASPVAVWSSTQNVRWCTVVGKSFSSPILTEKSVIVASEPHTLICLNREEGKILWKVETTPADLSDAKNRAQAAEYHEPEDGSGLTAATPLSDGRAIFAVFANGIVRCVDLNGAPKWTAYISAEQNTGYGRSASPIFAAGKLIVHMTHLYAFDPVTGRQLWENAAESTYGSPTSALINGIEVIVTPNGDVVNAADGKSLASDIGHCSNASPIVADGICYFADPTVKAVKLGAGFKAEDLWSGDITGEVFGSPILHNGVLFVVSGKGELYAYDAKGKAESKPLIEARALFGAGDTQRPSTFSSLTLAGNYLFLSSNKGETVVFEATRDAKEIARNALNAGSGASPVFSGKTMYLRAGDKLFCISE